MLVDGDLVLSDSSVICSYLDEAYPGHTLLPASPSDRARARWLEEFADTRLGDVFIWGLFYPKVVYPRVWGEEGDLERVETSVSPKMCHTCSITSNASSRRKAILFGDIGLADIAIASFFRNADYAGFAVDPGRWPKVARFRPRYACAPGVREAAEVRADSARLEHRGPAPGADRSRSEADRRNPRGEGTAPRDHAASQAWWPAIQCSMRVFKERRDGMKPCSGSSYPSPGAS